MTKLVNKIRSLYVDVGTFQQIPESERISLWAISSPQVDNLFRAKSKGNILLDLGCGPITSREPRERFYRPWWYLGVDFDVGNAPDVAADVARLPFADDSVGVILAASLLEHTYNYAEIVAEAHRVLKPGGYLLIQVPFLLEFHAYPHDYFRYTHIGIRRVLEDTGFNVLLLDIDWGKGFFLNMSKFCEDGSFSFAKPSLRFVLRLTSKALWTLRFLDRYYTGWMYQAIILVAEKME